MNYLFVVAHPDDESLGAGATIHKLVSDGHQVAVAIMCAEAAARSDKSETLTQDEAEAMKVLGVHKVYHAHFPNIQMNTVPHIELVKFIENCIEDWQTRAIFTHHPSDTNNDHVMTSLAAQAAARLFQRREGLKRLRQFAYMEVPSSTEWSFDGSGHFSANMFVEVGLEGIQQKLLALEKYKGVMRDYPHPRSVEAIRGLAAIRGVQAGCNYAEAFQNVFYRI